MRHRIPVHNPPLRRRISGGVPLVALTENPEAPDAIALLAACPVAEVQRTDRYQPRQADYIYAPDRPRAAMSAVHLCNVALCLAHQSYDFLVISHGLSDGSSVRTASAANALVLNSESYVRRLSAQPLAPGSTGRVLRLLPGPDDDLASVALDELGLGSLVRDGAELVVSPTGLAKRSSVPRRVAARPVLVPRVPERPLLLVLPGFLAVGGAERNMFEVLRHLRDRYELVIVSNRYLQAEQGSLHHQATEVSQVILDLGELAPPELHLAMLKSIRDALRPNVVWISNGSEWLVNHAEEVRNLFRTTPIIDQQIYDDRRGWIEHFARNPALWSFDRYIAGNHAIERALTQDHGISRQRVALIPHALSSGPYRPRELEPSRRREMLMRYALPDGRELFAFIGRLTDQKAPLDYLEVVRRWRAEPAIHFVMVGSGDLNAACDEFVRRHDLHNLTRITHIEDLRKLYPLLSGVVISSRFECLPLVVLESLAMGVPVISTDVGDVRRLLEEHSVGEVADGPGPEALSAALARFRDALPELTREARRSAAIVREEQAGATIADRYDACFRSAMAEFGASPTGP